VLFSTTSNFGLAGAALGMAVLIVSIYAWSFEPVNDPVEQTGH
jgi:hypothetical protein